VLLPSDIYRKPTTSVTGVLLPFVTYLLALSRTTLRVGETGRDRLIHGRIVHVVLSSVGV
jgi:hypothetical protein